MMDNLVYQEPTIRAAKARENLREQLWDEYDNHPDPDIFQNITVARDGGFSEVTDLWSNSRWVTAAVAIGALVSNTIVIIEADIEVLSRAGREGYIRGFLVTKTILTQMMTWLSGLLGRDEVLQWVPRGLEVICIVELALLAALLLECVRRLALVGLSTHACYKWTQVEKLFWVLLPELSSFSAMRLLHFVTISVVSTDAYAMWTETQQTPSMFKRALMWLGFVVSRMFFLIIGLDAFILKQRENAELFHGADVSFFKFWRLLVFLTQVLGIVQLGIFVKDRLFTFIFAGEDSIMQSKEVARKEIWNAMLAREIYRKFSSVQWFVIMLSFSDEDFQKLVLNEKGIARRSDDSDRDTSKLIDQSQELTSLTHRSSTSSVETSSDEESGLAICFSR
eukprot:gb/GFBE01037336.1/.p1 GENE.gb/GFBE01037336.1/~~gb/GFBE01037336.1/.p1  ORF type:complete len:394 (+),score=95.00 gb/GFBE01037336.1/:1-1182(+)